MLIRGNNARMATEAKAGSTGDMAVALVVNGGGGGGFAPTGGYTSINVKVDGNTATYYATLFLGEPSQGTYFGDVMLTTDCILPSGVNVALSTTGMASCSVTYGTMGDTQTEALTATEVFGDQYYLYAIPATGGAEWYMVEFALVTD